MLKPAVAGPRVALDRVGPASAWARHPGVGRWTCQRTPAFDDKPVAPRPLPLAVFHRGTVGRACHSRRGTFDRHRRSGVGATPGRLVVAGPGFQARGTDRSPAAGGTGFATREAAAGSNSVYGTPVAQHRGNDQSLEGQQGCRRSCVVPAGTLGPRAFRKRVVPATRCCSGGARLRGRVSPLTSSP